MYSSMQVKITYNIAASSATGLKTNDTLCYPLNESSDQLQDLQSSMARAAEDMNTVLTSWKDEIGQSEKEKERKAEEDARLAAKAKKANGTAAEDSSDEDEEPEA